MIEKSLPRKIENGLPVSRTDKWRINKAHVIARDHQATLDLLQSLTILNPIGTNDLTKNSCERMRGSVQKTHALLIAVSFPF